MPDSNLAKTVPLQVIGDQQHHRARALLEKHELLVRADSPGGVTGPIGLAYGFTNLHGALWVRIEDESRARELIENAGLFATGDSLPIVDRSEPHCPTCGGDLNSSSPDDEVICAACGLQLQWVDIDEPEVDPEGRCCDACGYELTGNTTGRCPECNAPILAKADLVVAAASRALDESGSTNQTEFSRAPKNLRELLNRNRILALSLAAAIIAGMIYYQSEKGQSSPPVTVLIGCVIGFAVFAMLTLIRAFVVTADESARDDKNGTGIR